MRSKKINESQIGQQLGNSALEAANAQNWSQAVEQMTEASRLCGTCPQSAPPHRNLVRSTGGLAGSRRLSRGNPPHSSWIRRIGTRRKLWWC